MFPLVSRLLTLLPIFAVRVESRQESFGRDEILAGLTSLLQMQMQTGAEISSSMGATKTTTPIDMAHDLAKKQKALIVTATGLLEKAEKQKKGGSGAAVLLSTRSEAGRTTVPSAGSAPLLESPRYQLLQPSPQLPVNVIESGLAQQVISERRQSLHHAAMDDAEGRSPLTDQSSQTSNKKTNAHRSSHHSRFDGDVWLEYDNGVSPSFLQVSGVTPDDDDKTENSHECLYRTGHLVKAAEEEGTLSPAQLDALKDEYAAECALKVDPTMALAKTASTREIWLNIRADAYMFKDIIDKLKLVVDSLPPSDDS